MVTSFARLALLSAFLALPTGCASGLQGTYVWSMEKTRRAIMRDVEAGLYKPDAASSDTLDEWKGANEDARQVLIAETGQDPFAEGDQPSEGE